MDREHQFMASRWTENNISCTVSVRARAFKLKCSGFALFSPRDNTATAKITIMGSLPSLDDFYATTQ